LDVLKFQHLAALALATSASAEAARGGQRSVHTSISIPTDATSRHSSPARDSPKSKLNRVRDQPLHRSTDSLHRAGAAGAREGRCNTLSHGNAAGVHHGRSREALARSTLQLNNTRQLAAAVANLPSYKDATNKNNWQTSDAKLSQETLLRK
jgi:hypothetical protein